MLIATLIFWLFLTFFMVLVTIYGVCYLFSYFPGLFLLAGILTFFVINFMAQAN